MILMFTVLAAGFARGFGGLGGSICRTIRDPDGPAPPPPIPTGRTADSATCLTEPVSQQSVQMTDNSEGEHVSDSKMTEVQGGAK